MSGKVLGIIPARSGSKRLPDKNKRLLGGKELIRYAIEAAQPSKYVSDWVLTTDDPDILNIGMGYEKITPLQRPAELAGDRSPAIDYVNHALLQFEQDFEVVVIIQPTSPFTLPEDIDGTVQLLWRYGAGSAASVVQVAHDLHPYKFQFLDKDARLTYLLSGEVERKVEYNMPEIYVRNGSVYASRTTTIATGVILSDDCVGYIMPRERSMDINDLQDFSYAEYLLSSKSGATSRK